MLDKICYELPDQAWAASNYSYNGQRLMGDLSPIAKLMLGEWRKPLHTLDSLREKASLVIGVPGTGKTEWMIAQAFVDACKGRPVIILDGKYDPDVLTKVSYYNGIIAGQRIYSFTPTDPARTHTWNPLFCPGATSNAVMESIFNAYMPPDKSEPRTGVYFTDFQRSVWRLLSVLLAETGLALTLNDFNKLLRTPGAFELLAPLVTSKQTLRSKYMELNQKVMLNAREFYQNLEGLTNWLDKVSEWHMNSYNPDIVFDEIIKSNSTLYIGLPINMERDTMAAIGKIILNQLRMVATRSQTSGTAKERRKVACYVDEVAAFSDYGMEDWASQSRTSGFMLTLLAQTLADFEAVGIAFASRLRANTPNIWCFNPRDVKTAEVMASLMGEEWTDLQSINSEGGMSIRGMSDYRIHPDKILHLLTGQCLFLPSEVVDAPFYLGAPMLPPPPPWVRYCRQRYPKSCPLQRGLYMGEKIEKAIQSQVLQEIKKKKSK